MIRKMYCIETDKNSLYVDKDVYDYIVSLEQQCKKQKEIIDKIKDIFNNGTFEDGCDCILIEKLLEDKEVE